MRYSTSILALAAPLAAFAAPARFYGKRSDTDILVLKFADVLEQFESSFYQSALAKFQASDFTAAGFLSPSVPTELFTVIQSDEATHSAALQSALKSAGQQPVTSCTFNFDSALTDVATMAATARVVENLGVAAYLGAAPLLSDPVLLQAAGSILTVEARHQTVLNLLSGTGSAIPQAFDIGFTPQEVLAVASPFLGDGCDLGVTANPTLTITNTGSVGAGTLLTFQSSALNGSSDNLFCQMLVGGAPFSISLPLSACIVPQGIDGPVALFITSDSQPLLNNVRDRATTQLVAGPTMAFIDSSSQTIGQLVRSSVAPSASNGTVTVTTSTISPDQASSIIASASAETATATVAAATAAVSAVNASGAASTAAIGASANGPSADGKLTVLGFS
ncbi:ferritin-like domain-containing protein [Armillaria nabsnona]|nr:ferritin-like domain-containing protein [Armillaria nabsnona]